MPVLVVAVGVVVFACSSCMACVCVGLVLVCAD